MHCGIPLLNPGVQIEYTFPAAITSTLSSQEGPVTHPNYTPPPRTLLKEDGRLVERRAREGSDLVEEGVCHSVCVCACVCGHMLTRDMQHHTCKGGLLPEDHMRKSRASQNMEQPLQRMI